MGADDGGIHEVQVPIEVAARRGGGLQGGQDLVPHPGAAPSVEPARHGADRAITLLRQVAPRRPGAMNPQDAIEDAAVIVVRTAGPGFFRGQQGLQRRPLAISQVKPQVRASKTSHIEQNRNSYCQPQPAHPLQTRPSTTLAVLFPFVLREPLTTERAVDWRWNSKSGEDGSADGRQGRLWRWAILAQARFFPAPACC